MKFSKFIAIAAMALALGSSMAACTKIDQGSVGVRARTLGDGGVDPTAIKPGWTGVGLGEEVTEYPVTQKQYTYSRPQQEGQANEEIVFSDKNGTPITGDVSITMNVNPALAPQLYKSYRLDFESLRDGQIRRDVQAAINSESDLIPVEQMFGGGRETLLSRALARVQKKWDAQGVTISQLQWIGVLRPPQSVIQSILARTQADSDVAKANAQVTVAEAEARVKVANAQGDADAARIRGQALAANPQILQQQALDKWDGVLPTVMGAGAPVPFINAK